MRNRPIEVAALTPTAVELIRDENEVFFDDFDLALRRFSPGQEVKVVVQRDGDEVTLNVTLAQPR